MGRMDENQVIVGVNPDSLESHDNPAQPLQRLAPSNLHDASISFEEYFYYAGITRQQEANLITSNPQELSTIQSSIVREQHTEIEGESDVAANEKTSKLDGETPIENESSLDRPTKEKKFATLRKNVIVTADEWEQANRAARTAKWGAIFYLITTDILGPSSAPWAIAQLGFAVGTVLYVLFGAFAAYGGYLMWEMFLGLDSYRYPMKNYGDLAFRIYGPYARHAVNILQAIQLIILVGIIILANGQGLSQMVNGKLCFVVCMAVWAIVGAVVGQIRPLQKLGIIAHISIWLNLFIIIATMVMVSRSGPNYLAAESLYGIQKGPMITSANTSGYVNLSTQVVGLMQAIFAYAGAMLFVEFMAEMRRPTDFLKAMFLAQTFIVIVYVIYGTYVYAKQGQFTVNGANSGISDYTWQTVTNAIGLVTAVIAAVLYSNICSKVLYNNIGVELLRFPPLESRMGAIIWVILTPGFWGFAFIIGGAIPQISNLSSLLAAVCMVQFTYTFPAWFSIGFTVAKDALTANEGYNPATGEVTRHDSGLKRFIRGYKRSWKKNTFNVFYCLGSVAVAVLGIYSGVLSVIEAYNANPNLRSLSCCSPITGC